MFIQSSALMAVDLAAFEGTCHNVTGYVDGHLKAVFTEDNDQIAGFVSATRWLHGAKFHRDAAWNRKLRPASRSVKQGPCHPTWFARDGLKFDRQPVVKVTQEDSTCQRAEAAGFFPRPIS